jgi:hypothetical protein
VDLDRTLKWLAVTAEEVVGEARRFWVCDEDYHADQAVAEVHARDEEDEHEEDLVSLGAGEAVVES